jgi:hypothetical protein
MGKVSRWKVSQCGSCSWVLMREGSSGLGEMSRAEVVGLAWVGCFWWGWIWTHLLLRSWLGQFE